jgi:hypothetical protein
VGEAGEALEQRRRRRLRPVEDDVEAAVEQGDGDPGAPAGREDLGEQSPEDRQEGHDPRLENQAGGKVHDRMAAGFCEAQGDHAAIAGRSLRGQGRSPSLSRGDFHRRAKLVAGDARLRQGAGEPADLPGEVGFGIEVLQRAAATAVEVRTRRRDAIRRRIEDLDDLGRQAIAPRLAQPHPHPLAGQAPGHVQPPAVRRGRQTVPAPAQPLDDGLDELTGERICRQAARRRHPARTTRLP